MGFFDRLFGGGDDRRDAPAVPVNTARSPLGDASAYRDADGRYAPPGEAARAEPPGGVPGQASDDQQAIERYRYLLRTAPPETIEQVHAEAFGRLTQAQREQVLADLSTTLPAAERPESSDPQALARAATRAEYTQPGYMERTFGGRSFGQGGVGGGFGSMLGASMLGTIGGYVIGSALVSAFMAPAFAADGAGDQAASGDGSAEGDSAGGEGGGESAGDAGAGWDADAGGDVGGGFGDFGGGDFGGFDGF